MNEHNSTSNIETPFYLTRIWHRFSMFKQRHSNALIIRKKQVLQKGFLKAGQNYYAELDLLEEKQIKGMTLYRYRLTIEDDSQILYVIETTFLESDGVMTEQEAATLDYPPIGLPLELNQEDIEQYLKEVEDDNPLHIERGLLPGDYVAIKALQVVNAQRESELDFKKMDIKYINKMWKTDALAVIIQASELQNKVIVCNQQGEKCLIITLNA